MKRRLSRKDMAAIRKMDQEDIDAEERPVAYKPTGGFNPEAMIRQIELDRLRRLLNKQNYGR